MHENTGLRKRYTISYIAVAIIPTLIVLTLYVPMIDLFKEEAIKTDSLRTNTIQVAIDERIQEMHHLSVQISTNKKVIEFLYKEAPLNNEARYYIRDLSDFIKSCKAGNSFISLIAVYLVQSSSVVTHEGVYPSDYFFENIVKYEGMESSAVKDMMTGYFYNKCLPLKEINGYGPLNGEYITYMQTVPIGETHALANVILFIGVNEILAITGGTDPSFPHQTMILSNEGEVISSVPADKELRETIFHNIGESNSGSFTLDFPDQSSMVVSYSRSKVNDWICITFFSMDDILLRVRRIRNIAIMISIIGLGIGISLSFLMADSSYKPWALLTDEMKQLHSKESGDHEKSKNEYFMAMDAIQNIRAERAQMQRDMDKSDSYIQKFMLQNFCLGKGSSGYGKEWSSFFPYPLYCVILVDMDDKVHLLQKIDRTLNKLISTYLQDCMVHTFEDERNRLCIVLNTVSVGAELLVEQTRRIAGRMSEHFDLLLVAGVGGIYENTEGIYASYKEAKEALEYCFLKGKDSVVYFADIQKTTFRSLNIPVYSDNPLLNSVKTGDIKNCTGLLDKYFKDIMESNCIVSAQYMYCLFYNFISVIIKACNEMNVDFEVIFQQTPEQFLDLDRYRNTRQMIDGVYQAYIIMCEYMQKNKMSHNNALREHISTYIHSNYTDPGISLEQVAETFGYSSSYLSRFIKQEFGMGFGELLNKIRLERAKRLLSSDLRPIGEISAEVGYMSSNSFIRAFKREDGSTPGQYRNAFFQQS